MSDGPLAEAEFAEATLQEQPDTPLRPYLWKELFGWP